jgi:predicted aminopeptidase
MVVGLRWLRLMFSFCFFFLCSICVIHYQTSIYLLSQAKGQLSVLGGTVRIAEFKQANNLGAREAANLQLIETIKRYSVDSLGYLPTDNFTSIYDQSHSPLLWVITACEPYAFRAYSWVFPLVGRVSYKGFFNQELAQKEYHHLVALGYDVDLRSVSAWSTLGWFDDPLLSGMLGRSKAGLCNLLFHELFHATYYAPSSVDLNENLANFIADKATLRFLRQDTAELRLYKESNADELIFSNYMLRKKQYLETFYQHIRQERDQLALKLKMLAQIADSVGQLPLHHPARFKRRAEDITKFKNAYFVDFQQYESMQDSLQSVFNKIYRGDLKKLVRDLRLNKINY